MELRMTMSRVLVTEVQQNSLALAFLTLGPGLETRRAIVQLAMWDNEAFSCTLLFTSPKIVGSDITTRADHVPR
jgi:hypothetical protein